MGFILEIKIHEYNGNDVIDDLQKLGLKYVPGEVFEDDTILIEIEKEQSEKVKNQNPLHIIASMQNVQLIMLSVTKWFGMVDGWALHLVLIVVLLVKGGKQSQLLVLGLRLDFDKKCTLRFIFFIFNEGYLAL